ncbi:hypothetical protein ACFOOM_28315 [Streptomyces echinoruber]|uniref:hypothetical protein n=1 Tax=Streptomyces echinoruber TaxID=68898 RepID=UPI0036076654
MHTVAQDVFATRIDTNRMDYRFARSEGGRAELTEWHLPDELAEKCLALASRLALPLAGIDLLLAGDGEPYCFEINPSPAFSFYQSHTGQPISRAVALHLARGANSVPHTLVP